MIRDVKYAKYHIDNELTGKIIKIDEGFTAITGYEWDDVSKKNMYIFDLVPEEAREDYVNTLYSFREKGEAYINHQILCKARSLKLATDLRALQITAFWPVMMPRSFTIASISLALFLLSPQRTLTITLSSLGICMTLL